MLEGVASAETWRTDPRSEISEPSTIKAWRLTVHFEKQEAVQVDVPAGTRFKELHAILGADSGQMLITTHRRHTDQSFVVDRLDQLNDGFTVLVQTPKRRIYISALPDVHKKAVTWYADTTVEQLSRAIARAAGFTGETPVELRDGEASIVLSTSIPNDTHLEVVPYLERKPERPPPAPAPAPAPAAAPSSPPQPTRSASATLGSRRGDAWPSPRRGAESAAVRRGSSPSRSSPQRSRSVVNSMGSGGNTTPAARESAPEEHCIHTLAGHVGFVLCLCSVGDILFTGSQDSNIMIWDLNNLQYIGTLPGHRGFVKCLYSSYATKKLCSGSQDRTIRIWSLDTFSTLKTLYGHTAAVNSVLTIDGSSGSSAPVLISGSEDKSIKVWDLNTYAVLHNLEQAHLGGVFALQKFGGGSGGTPQVVSGARDRSLKVWDPATWSNPKTLTPPHYDAVMSIAVSAKHGKFYSASRDRSIKEWDVAALSNTMHSLHVHQDWVQALCMSTSEDILFSGSKDHTVKVWDGDLQCQDVLQGHRGPVSALCCVDFFRQGEQGARRDHLLFSASHDRTVRVWRVGQYG